MLLQNKKIVVLLFTAFWATVGGVDCLAASPPLNLRVGAVLEGVGGLQGDPPALVESSNQIIDPGFEDGSTAWSLGSCFSVDNSVAHSGTKSLRLDLGGSCGNVRQLKIKIGNRNYRFRGWVKTQNVSGAKPVMARFDLTHGTTAMGSNTGADGTTDWTLIDVAGGLGSGHTDDTVELRIYLSKTGTPMGTVWFDDFEIVPAYSPLNLFVLYPNYRGYLWADLSQEVKAVINFQPPPGYSSAQLSLQWSIADAVSKAQLYKAAILSPQPENPISWDGSALPEGAEVLLSVSLVRKSDGEILVRHPDYRIVKASASFRNGLNNWIDPENVLHHTGAKRFVWGVYDRLSGSYRPGGISTSRAAYEAVPGFAGLTTMENYRDTRSNTVLYFSPFSGANPGYPLKSSDQLNPWVEALRARGAMHLQIVNTYYDGSAYRPTWAGALTEEALWTVIGERITDPGFLGYYTADEPDLAGAPHFEQASRQYRTLRRVNKGAVTYEVFFRPAPVWNWRDTADVFGADPYPLGAGVLGDDYLYGDGSKPLYGRVDLWTRDTINATKESRPIWMVLQLWTQAGVFPTYDEMRRLAWKAIAAGAHGVLWWGFVSASGMEYQWYGGYQKPCSPAPCDPNAYPDYKRISTEVMDLESVLVEPDVSGFVTCSDPKVNVRVKRSQGKIWIFTSNTTNLSLPAVTFSTGLPLSDAVSVYTEDRSLQPSAGSWSDSFDRQGVHVYSVLAP